MVACVVVFGVADHRGDIHLPEIAIHELGELGARWTQHHHLVCKCRCEVNEVGCFQPRTSCTDPRVRLHKGPCQTLCRQPPYRIQARGVAAATPIAWMRYGGCLQGVLAGALVEADPGVCERCPGSITVDFNRQACIYHVS
mgnify:CR=1 FL=1